MYSPELNSKIQQEKGDSLTEVYVSELWDFTRSSMSQNNLQELKEWTSTYSELWLCIGIPLIVCFIFGRVDLVPTVEEYTILFCFLRNQADKAYSRAANALTFSKKLMSITKMRFDLGTFGYEEKGRCLFFEYLRKEENVSYRVFSENYSLLKELVATLRRDNIFEEKWMKIL
ncbi:hypothetical protein Goari_027248 [Gossypium aridum]|uniref:Uncharacterized protein n=1 Tax=Gossypium aridum TaxID=34290 RepID=A0A7J8YTA5_GOSAI|nr:hypothetical protein [Gossypium aridum]